MKGLGLNYPSKNFGILIAYVLPGFIALWGLATKFGAVNTWLTGTNNAGLAVGGVLYVTAASITIGMVINAVRWLIIDPALLLSGLTRPDWNAVQLQGRLSAFERLVEDHFRYFQFYANTALGSLVAFLAWRSSPFHESAPGLWPEVGIVALEFVLLLASRDALSRYYRRTQDLLETENSEEELET
ncbi:MAG: hypothetical protein DWQ01_18670 [Planctomycetota bacterium]|nr:MAG: hypothetical protein DWQ01_18670 [Planctomycetota bacterium]